jgi:hypothetical protein
MPFINKYNVGAASGGGGGVSDHGSLTGLTDNDHPQYAPSTDWTPPPFQYKDADEITVLAGRYHKGGHRLYGHYQNLTGMADYWDVAANFDVDIDATYSAGSTSGMLGGDVISSWYSLWMVDSDEILVLPMIRIDAQDYNVSNASKTTINPALHSDGTTAGDGYLTANDQWNNYRLMVLTRDSNRGTLLTIEDCANGTPDEIIIDGDQTAYLSDADWLLLIPPSTTDCVYLGSLYLDSSGDIEQFSHERWGEYSWAAPSDIAPNKSSSFGNTDLGAYLSPLASMADLLVHCYSENTDVIAVRAEFAHGSSGSTYKARVYTGTGSNNSTYYNLTSHVTWSLSATASIRNRFEEATAGWSWGAMTDGWMKVAWYRE